MSEFFSPLCFGVLPRNPCFSADLILSDHWGSCNSGEIPWTIQVTLALFCEQNKFWLLLQRFGQVWSRKAKVSEIYYVLLSSGRVTNNIHSESNLTVSGHFLRTNNNGYSTRLEQLRSRAIHTTTSTYQNIAQVYYLLNLVWLSLVSYINYWRYLILITLYTYILLVYMYTHFLDNIFKRAWAHFLAHK